MRVTLGEIVRDAYRGAATLVHEVSPPALTLTCDGDGMYRLEREAIGDKARQETLCADVLVHTQRRARGVTATVKAMPQCERWRIHVRVEG